MDTKKADLTPLEQWTKDHDQRASHNLKQGLFWLAVVMLGSGTLGATIYGVLQSAVS